MQLNKSVILKLEKQNELTKFSEIALSDLKILLSKIESQIEFFNQITYKVQVIRKLPPMSNELQNIFEVEEMQIGSFKLDLRTRMLTRNENSRKLTKKETYLLAYLNAHLKKEIKRSDCLIAIWGEDNYYNARRMDVYVCKLRKYLKDDTSIYLINLHGRGYRFLY